MKSKYSIKKEILETVMHLSKKHYPNEFGAMLVEESNIINDLYIIPLTKDYATSVSFRLDMVPMRLNIVGSIHSHPSGQGTPSNADLSFFSRKFINIIVYPPFSINDFKAYNKKGQRISIDIV